MADNLNMIDINKMGTTALAYVGDAEYELRIRKHVIAKLPNDVNLANHNAVSYVSSAGQAKIAKEFCKKEFLTYEEERLLKRARNHRATSRPKTSDPRNYKWATGFEALVGFLYLSENWERLDEVVAEAISIVEA
ncbi:MAG: ribonuclease III [Clostridiales bacterium]|jgi:ribonuclease-3 family protein|nr:ribonuclease III [Clostridiales bacterium]